MGPYPHLFSLASHQNSWKSYDSWWTEEETEAQENVVCVITHVSSILYGKGPVFVIVQFQLLETCLSLHNVSWKPSGSVAEEFFMECPVLGPSASLPLNSSP